MKLEEAKKICKDFIEENKSRKIILHTAIEILLQELENSISKYKVREQLDIEIERFNVYKKASDENENLKNRLWYHMGMKNMCERLLGIEKTVTLD